MGWKVVEFDGKDKMKNVLIGALDTSNQGYQCEYSSVRLCLKLNLTKRTRLYKMRHRFCNDFLSVSTEFLQNATPVLFVCPILFSASIGLSKVVLSYTVHRVPTVVLLVV